MPEIHLHSLCLSPAERTSQVPMHLSADELQRAGSMPLERAWRFRQSRSFVRQILASRLQCTPLDLEFDWPTRGKPRLANRRLQFNISHTQDLLVLAVCAEGDVGIDLESPGRSNRIEDIAKRYFAPDEQEWIAQAADPAEREWRFLQLWTLKESLSKLLGCGIGPKVLRHISHMAGQRPQANPAYTGAVSQAFVRFDQQQKPFLLSVAAAAGGSSDMQLTLDLATPQNLLIIGR